MRYSKVIKLFSATCWKNRPVEYYLVKILSNNQHSRHIFEKLGAVMIGHEGNLYSSVLEDLKKVFQSDINRYFITNFFLKFPSK